VKTYRLSFAASCSHVPQHPERTAKRNLSGLDFDVIYQIWPSRAAMLKTIDMQGKRAPRGDDWKACKMTGENARSQRNGQPEINKQWENADDGHHHCLIPSRDESR
jgi:hypothetical protein